METKYKDLVVRSKELTDEEIKTKYNVDNRADRIWSLLIKDNKTLAEEQELTDMMRCSTVSFADRLRCRIEVNRTCAGGSILDENALSQAAMNEKIKE